MNIRLIGAVALKEWKETTRDRLFLLLAFLLPALWLVVFGYGLNLDVEEIPLAALDRDHSALSRDYLYRFIQSRYFSFHGYADDERALGAAEHLPRRLAAAIDAEPVGNEVVSDESPNVGALRRAEHLDACLVTEDKLALAHSLKQARRQRCEQLGMSMKEIGHRATRDRDAESAILLLEPIERNRIAALAHDQVRDKARAILRLVCRALWRWCVDDVLAAAA